MNTTLSNTGVLNERSVKLDSNDLVVLDELLRNCTTEIGSTPEILIQSIHSVRRQQLTGQQIGQSLPGPEKSTFVDQTHQPVPPPKRKPAVEIELPSEQLKADQVAQAEIDSLLQKRNTNAEVAGHAADNAATEQKKDSPEILLPANKVDEISIKEQIEHAKQYAIEATKIAASMKYAQQTGAANFGFETEPVAIPVKESLATHTQTVADNQHAVNSLELNQRTIARNNRAVAEISTALAEKLQASDRDEMNSDPSELPPTNQAPITITHLAGKQLEQLADNVLERTIPGTPASILLTACQQDDKRREIATHLATTLADRDLGKTLLIDGDFKTKGLSNHLIEGDSVGLSEALSQTATLSKCVVKTNNKNLDVLSAGTAVVEDSETLNDNLLQIFSKIKRDYRFLIISGPPAESSFVKQWGTLCESAYLVVAIGETNSSIATRAVKKLQTNGTRLLGLYCRKSIINGRIYGRLSMAGRE